MSSVLHDKRDCLVCYCTTVFVGIFLCFCVCACVCVREREREREREKASLMLSLMFHLSQEATWRGEEAVSLNGRFGPIKPELEHTQILTHTCCSGGPT